jgi:hypothetical protein
MERNEGCGICAYYDNGYCLRYPPTSKQREIDSYYMPEVKVPSWGWCGEYKRTTKAIEAPKQKGKK